MPADTDLQHALAAFWDRETETTFYEPWIPRVGQRVRVVLGGECAAIPDADSPLAHQGGHGHSAWQHGLLGVVDEIATAESDPDLVAQGHRYAVLWDEPHVDERGLWLGGAVYAACELLPIDDQAGEEER
jgi:hypothetical protein